MPKEAELDQLIKPTLASDVEKQTHHDEAKKILEELNFPPAAQTFLLYPDRSPTGLASITSSSELIIQVRESLSAVIDSIEESPSIFSQLSKVWTKMSGWERIGIWLAISATPLAVGFMANIGFLMGLSISTTIGAAMIADDSSHSRDFTEKLKKGIFGIADALVLTISALDTVRHRLQNEVANFRKENQRLSHTVYELSDQVYALSIQIQSFALTEKHLRETEIKLQELAKKYEEGEERNQQLLDETQEEIRRITPKIPPTIKKQHLIT